MELLAYITLFNCLLLCYVWSRNSHLSKELHIAKHRIDTLVQAKQAEYAPFKQVLDLPPTQDQAPKNSKKNEVHSKR